MKTAPGAILVTTLFLICGCGGGGANSNPNLSLAYLEAPPANIASSPSDGQPVSYAILQSQNVPIVQCPHDPNGSGLIICDGPAPGQMQTICILWANVPNYRGSATDYLGQCH
jgi:hypothetical protein